MKITQIITESQHYEDSAKYAVDTQTGEVVDGPFERYSEIPLRLMGYDGGHKIVSGAVLNGKSEEDLDEAGYNSYVSSYNNNRKGFSSPGRDMSDESNLMYAYREERLKQGMVSNQNRDRAHAEGFRDTPEAALKLHGIIRSKFDPKKWIQKHGTKWVEVHPYGQKELEEDLPPPEKARDTQIPGTLPTYKKAAAMLDKHGAQGKSIDFGAGLGLGTGELGKDAESYEPFPKEHFKPNYVDVTKVPSNKYHRLVNLNVLNVVPNVGERRDRDNIVRNIGRVLAPGGIAIITTRGKDVLGAKGTAGEEAWSIITSKGTYQKGFSQSELREYVKGILGDGFEVSSVKLGPAGVMIKKIGKTKKLNELSNDTLGAYKKKAGAAASAADKRGDTEEADKRFHGIVQATKKELENDVKSHSKDAVGEAIAAFEDHIDEHIVKVKGGYELKSKHGDKNLGKYPTKAGAEKRERQVQYFKHAGK